MVPLTVDGLLAWLVRTHFVNETQAQPFRAQSGRYTDALALARDLVKADLLTPYQVNQIWQGNVEQLILGSYRIMQRLGEGAMGQVFKCWSQKLALPVAIKMIRKQHLASKKALGRFRREMEAAAKLHHPNIVFLRDADEIDNHPFLVMDYVDGLDLARLLKMTGPLPAWQAADYARQTALGLQHAFERGVVHRDIKPGNLLVTREAQPMLKISDFGLARFESEGDSQRRLTQHGTVLGTIDYIAPEQVQSAWRADIRADIYSLGCSLHYLLTTKPPFPGADMVEKVNARLSGELEDIRVQRPEVPAGLAAVLRRMTARAPEARYQTPREVALALTPYCAPESDAVVAAVAVPALAIPAIAVPTPRAGQQSTAASRVRPLAVACAGARVGGLNQDRDPFNFETVDDAEPEDVLTSLPAPPMSSAPRLQAKKRRFLRYVIGGFLAVAVGLVAFFLLRGCSGPVEDRYPAHAALAVTLRENERTLAPGDHKHVIFSVRRTNFSGPVEVRLEKTPEGVGPNPNSVTLDAKKNDGELPLFVYQFAKRETARIRVRATAKNLVAEDWLQLTIERPGAAQGPEER